MKRKITAGITGVTLPIFVSDTTSTVGGGLSGLTPSTSGLTCEYRRQGTAVWTSIPLVSGVLGTWGSGSLVTDGSLPGAYEFGLPDTVVASGARWVAIRLYGAPNMLPCLIELELDAVNYQDSQRFGLTCLPALGTLAVNPFLASSQNFSTTGSVGSVINGVTVSLNNDKTGYSVNSVGDKTGYSLASTQTFSTTGSIGSVMGSVSISGKPAVSLSATDVIGTLPAIVIAYGNGLDPGSMVLVNPSNKLATDSSNRVTASTVANGVTVSVNNDKTGYSVQTVLDKTGYSLSATQAFSTTGSVGSVANGVTVATNNDKTGYIVTTVTDKSGYFLAASQTFSTSGTVGKVSNVTNPVVIGINQDKQGYVLSSNGLDQVQVERGINARQALALTVDSVGAGVVTGASTTTITVLDPGNTSPRIVATVDADGNRTSIRLTPPL